MSGDILFYNFGSETLTLCRTGDEFQRKNSHVHSVLQEHSREVKLGAHGCGMCLN